MRLSRLSEIYSLIPNRLVERVGAFVGAIRYVRALVKQLPVQPLLAALVISLVVGAIPMMLTALYSVARTVIDWYRHAARLHHRVPGNRAHSDELISPLELL
jgi:hypothetical protein